MLQSIKGNGKRRRKTVTRRKRMEGEEVASSGSCLSLISFAVQRSFWKTDSASLNESNNCNLKGVRLQGIRSVVQLIHEYKGRRIKEDSEKKIFFTNLELEE